MYNTKAELTAALEKIIIKTVTELQDSPMSRIAQCQKHIGYYFGYCEAMGWDWDIAAELKWEAMMTSGKVYVDASVISV
jgi:hypothetical protein